MDLTLIWFLLVGVLLIGYFVLDGFDFGVGMALPFLGKDNVDRRLIINTIGPVWDLNETWLIVAGACLFAAFPEWYATMFSGLYLALLLILVALILRGVSFEFRHQGKGPRWTGWFDRFIFWGSLLPPFLWGTAFANLVQGLPIVPLETGGWVYTGSLLTLLNPYGLLGGLAVTLLCFVHGLVFIALKTTGEMRARARSLATKIGAVTILVAAGFLLWTVLLRADEPNFVAVLTLSVLAALALVIGFVSNLAGREGWAFTFNAATIAFALLAIFMALFPYLMISSIDAAYSMSIQGAASSQKTLELMTWVAGFTLPLVLAYQAWTYWIFRKRLSREQILAHDHEDEHAAVTA